MSSGTLARPDRLVRFLTVPWTYSTAQPGRVEWQPTASLLWDRLAHDEPLGSLRGDSIPVAPAPTASAAPSAPAPEELADAGLCT